jgi:hypothetical protein
LTSVLFDVPHQFADFSGPGAAAARLFKMNDLDLRKVMGSS